MYFTDRLLWNHFSKLNFADIKGQFKKNQPLALHQAAYYLSPTIVSTGIILSSEELIGERSFKILNENVASGGKNGH